jgi:WD40 repeat protein
MARTTDREQCSAPIVALAAVGDEVWYARADELCHVGRGRCDEAVFDRCPGHVAAFHATETLRVMCSSTCEAILRDDRLEARRSFRTPCRVAAVRLVHDGIVLACCDGTCWSLDAVTGELRQVGRITARALATSASVVRGSSGQYSAVFGHMSGEVTMTQVSPNEKPHSREKLFQFVSRVWCLATCDDVNGSGGIVAASSCAELRLVLLATGRQVSHTALDGEIHGLALRAATESLALVACGLHDGRLVVLKWCEDGVVNFASLLPRHGGPVKALCFLQGADAAVHLASGGVDGVLIISPLNVESTGYRAVQRDSYSRVSPAHGFVTIDASFIESLGMSCWERAELAHVSHGENGRFVAVDVNGEVILVHSNGAIRCGRVCHRTVVSSAMDEAVVSVDCRGHATCLGTPTGIGWRGFSVKQRQQRSGPPLRILAVTHASVRTWLLVYRGWFQLLSPQYHPTFAVGRWHAVRLPARLRSHNHVLAAHALPTDDVVRRHHAVVFVVLADGSLLSYSVQPSAPSWAPLTHVGVSSSPWRWPFVVQDVFSWTADGAIVMARAEGQRPPTVAVWANDCFSCAVSAPTTAKVGNVHAAVVDDRLCVCVEEQQRTVFIERPGVNCTRTCGGHGDDISAVVAVPAMSCVVMAGLDGRVSAWRVERNETLRLQYASSQLAHLSAVLGLTTLGHSSVVSVGGEMTVCRWEVLRIATEQNTEAVLVLRASTTTHSSKGPNGNQSQARLLCVASPADAVVVTGDSSGHLRLWTVALDHEPHVVSEVVVDGTPIFSVAAQRDGAIAAGTSDGRVTICAVEGGQLTKARIISLTAHSPTAVTALAFHVSVLNVPELLIGRDDGTSCTIAISDEAVAPQCVNTGATPVRAFAVCGDELVASVEEGCVITVTRSRSSHGQHERRVTPVYCIRGAATIDSHHILVVGQGWAFVKVL